MYFFSKTQDCNTDKSMSVMVRFQIYLNPVGNIRGLVWKPIGECGPPLQMAVHLLQLQELRAGELPLLRPSKVTASMKGKNGKQQVLGRDSCRWSWCMMKRYVNKETQKKMYTSRLLRVSHQAKRLAPARAWDQSGVPRANKNPRGSATNAGFFKVQHTHL